MGLNCLLLTTDETLLGVFRTGFNATSVELEMRTDAASTIELSARRHLDGFIIDGSIVPCLNSRRLSHTELRTMDLGSPDAAASLFLQIEA